MDTATDPATPTVDSREALLDAIEAHLARTGASPTVFGREALANPSFVGRLRKGAGVRLSTADRVRAFMGHAPRGPAFLREVEAFLSVTRVKPHVFGELAAGDPCFVVRLRRGASPTLATVDRVRAWMAASANARERAAVRAAAAGDEGGPHESQSEGETGMEDDLYMDTREAAAHLKLSPRTLDRYRVTGEGPPFHRFGNRVRYLRADLAKWAAARRVRSTADEGAAGRREE